MEQASFRSNRNNGNGTGLSFSNKVRAFNNSCIHLRKFSHCYKWNSFSRYNYFLAVILVICNINILAEFINCRISFIS